MDGITYDADRQTYLRRYASDIRKLTAQIATAGGSQRPTVVWVLQGPDPSASGARYTWPQYLPCTAYERAHPDHCTQPGNGRTALHRDDDYLHFCLAPTTSTPRPCPVRSPGILRMAREITRVTGSQAPSRSAG